MGVLATEYSRSFVWKNQIESLLILSSREISINSHLVWKQNKVVEENSLIIISEIKLTDFYVLKMIKQILILDGQQRLQSLFLD